MDPSPEANQDEQDADLDDYERAIGFRWNDPRYLAHFIALGGVIAPSILSFEINGVSYVSLAGGAVAIVAAIVAIAVSLRVKHGRAYATLVAIALLFGGVARLILSGLRL